MEEAKTAVDPAEEPVDSNKDLTVEVEKPPKPVPLYSSATSLGPRSRQASRHRLFPSAKANPPDENGKDIPPSTVLFSSSHRDSRQNRISPPPRPLPPGRGIDRSRSAGCGTGGSFKSSRSCVSEPVNEPAAVEVPPPDPVTGEKSASQATRLHEAKADSKKRNSRAGHAE